MLDLVERREARLGPGANHLSIAPAIVAAGVMGGAGLLSGFLGAKKKTTEQFDRTRQYEFFSSPEQNALSTELGQTASPLNQSIQNAGGTYQALASEGEKFAKGTYLDANEEGNQQFLQATTRPMERAFKEQTTPDLLSYIARGRGFGGQRASDLFRQTYRDYTESVGDVTGRAMGQLAQMRTSGYQAAGGTMAALTDSATRLNSLRAQILPQLQLTREFGVGSGTSTPSGQDQAQNALLQALVMYGGAKNM